MRVEVTEVGITAGGGLTAAHLPETFTAAFAELYGGVFHAAYRLLGNRQESEDVAQEACGGPACVGTG